MTPEEEQVLDDRAAELIDDVLEYARGDVGPLLTRLLELDMNDVVRIAWESGVSAGLRGTLRVLTADPDPEAGAPS